MMMMSLVLRWSPPQSLPVVLWSGRWCRVSTLLVIQHVCKPYLHMVLPLSLSSPSSSSSLSSPPLSSLSSLPLPPPPSPPPRPPAPPPPTVYQYLNNSIKLFKPLSSDLSDQYSNFVEWQTKLVFISLYLCECITHFTDTHTSTVLTNTSTPNAHSIGPLPSDNASSFTSSLRTDLSTNSFITYSNGIYPMVSY